MTSNSEGPAGLPKRRSVDLPACKASVGNPEETLLQPAMDRVEQHVRGIEALFPVHDAAKVVRPADAGALRLVHLGGKFRSFRPGRAAGGMFCCPRRQRVRQARSRAPGCEATRCALRQLPLVPAVAGVAGAAGVAGVAVEVGAAGVACVGAAAVEAGAAAVPAGAACVSFCA